jgi:hypothetical protein
MSDADRSERPLTGQQSPAREALERLARGRRRYAEEWSGNATTFARDGHYAWMAALLEGHDPILEIGPGNGCGTVALVTCGHAVVAVDENPDCLDRTHAGLVAATFDVVRERRELLDTERGGYTVRYGTPASAVPKRGALLLDGDVLNDPELESWLIAHRPFGAVACWLMGTYFERTQNTRLKELSIASPDNYRMRVHEKVFQLAGRVLRDDGIVHVVDRTLLVPDDTGARPGSAPWLARARATYDELARPHAFGVTALDLREYVEPSADAGPSIRMSRSLSGVDPEVSPKAFLSVRFAR